MTMPRHPSSYEQLLHVLLQNLAAPTLKETIRIEKKTPEDAIKFRLRYYAFCRTVLADAEKRMDKAIAKNYPKEILNSIQRDMDNVYKAKRFIVKVQGSDVLFSDRDQEDELITNGLFARLLMNNKLADEQTKKAVEQYTIDTREKEENLFGKFFDKDKAESLLQKPKAISPLVEAMQDVPEGKTSKAPIGQDEMELVPDMLDVVSTPKQINGDVLRVNNMVMRVRFGKRPEELLFVETFDTSEMAQTFELIVKAELEKIPNLRPYTIVRNASELKFTITHIEV